MKLETKSLRSKVAQRIFILFVSCALIPVGTLAILSFYQVSKQLREQSRQHLQQAAKSQGMATFERLEMFDTELQDIALRLDQRGKLLSTHGLSDRFVSVELISLPKLPAVPSSSSHPDLTADEIVHLNSGKSLLRTHDCRNGLGKCIQMLRLLNSDSPSQRVLAGDINPKYLWAADRLSAELSICVFDQTRKPLLCSSDEVAPTIGRGLPASQHISSGSFQWNGSAISYDAAYWSLFLNPQFHTGAWTIVLSQPHSEALAPMTRFRGLFPFIVLLALWVVILLSLVQIRRTLVPLEKLKDGTKQIGAQNFDARVEIDSDDEFQDLATSFNSMGQQLGKQFHALKTINDIDRSILESLDRRRVIDSTLEHMPFLLSANCFAIALFDNWLTSVDMTVREAKEKGKAGSCSEEGVSSQLSKSDLDQILEHPQFLTVNKGDRTPTFLSPLAARGVASFVVFPIFVDRTSYAALICAWQGPVQIQAWEVEFARQVADQLAVAFSNIQLIEALEQFHWGTLTALARAIDAKSAWTAGHSERVTAMAVRIAKAMGMAGKDLQVIQRGGLLHDIGKIGTPASVLDKPGKLEPDELKTMRDHVRIGLRILEPIPAFKEAIPIVAQHHEWFNGKGYPEGLAGEEISLYARIFAVADCFDALKSDRPYRQGLPTDRVMEILKAGSGTQFDPKVMDAFLRMCSEADSHQPTETSKEMTCQRS